MRHKHLACRAELSSPVIARISLFSPSNDSKKCTTALPGHPSVDSKFSKLAYPSVRRPRNYRRHLHVNCPESFLDLRVKLKSPRVPVASENDRVRFQDVGLDRGTGGPSRGISCPEFRRYRLPQGKAIVNRTHIKVSQLANSVTPTCVMRWVNI